MYTITFLPNNADLANLHVLKRLLPNHTEREILGNALRALRETLESQPPREPITQSAADSIRDLFGD